MGFQPPLCLLRSLHTLSFLISTRAIGLQAILLFRQTPTLDGTGAICRPFRRPFGRSRVGLARRPSCPFVAALAIGLQQIRLQSILAVRQTQSINATIPWLTISTSVLRSSIRQSPFACAFGIPSTIAIDVVPCSRRATADTHLGTRTGSDLVTVECFAVCVPDELTSLGPLGLNAVPAIAATIMSIVGTTSIVIASLAIPVVSASQMAVQTVYISVERTMGMRMPSPIVMPVVRDARSIRSVPVIVPVEPIEISVQAESVRNGKPPLIV